MDFNREKYTNEELIHLYRNLLFPRMIEEKMLVLLRQGKSVNGLVGLGRKPLQWVLL